MHTPRGRSCRVFSRVDPATTPSHERALALFEAFLQYARNADGARAEGPPPRRPSGVQKALDSFLPPPPGASSEPPRRGTTGGNRAVTPKAVVTDSRAAVDPGTAVVHASQVPKRPTPGAAARSDTDLAVELPEMRAPATPRVEERSIIVEPDTIPPPAAKAPTPAPAPAPAPVAAPALAPPTVDGFLQEMMVLIKYGHARQSAQECERWITSNPDAFEAHLKVNEFQFTRLDRDLALQRYAWLVARLVERGRAPEARDVVERLLRQLPDDPRVVALTSQLGRATSAV